MVKAKGHKIPTTKPALLDEVGFRIKKEKQKPSLIPPRWLLHHQIKAMVEYFHYDDIVTATDGFSPARLIGKGSHGSVFLARLPNRRHPVAVKMPMHGDLRTEIRVLSSLRTTRHVIHFLGTCRHRDSHLLVTEYMPNGSLHHLLHAAAKPPSWPERLRIAAEVARAVRFLHDEAAVVHRDIKPENVLLDAGYAAKLADFGLAVQRRGEEDPGRPAGTIGYMDPGYTSAEKVSFKNDAFSFGVLVLETVSGRRAVEVGREPAGVVEWAVPLIRERRMKEVWDGRVGAPVGGVAEAVNRLLLVAAGCVSGSEVCRPAMAEVVSAMECDVVERERFLASLVAFIRRRRKKKKKKQQHEHRECHPMNTSSSRNSLLFREILAFDSEF